MLENIKMTKTSYIKKENTKTVWQATKEENDLISENKYNNIIEAKRFFQNLGYKNIIQGYSDRDCISQKAKINISI